jgi:hypothetical protein
MQAAIALLGAILCAPAPHAGEHVAVAEESAVIVWDAGSKTEHFIRRATFSGGARDFGFLVPTPRVPTLARVDDDVFDRMREKTTQRMVRDTVNTIDWTPLLLMPWRSVGYKGEGAVATSAPVQVLSTQKVAGYEAAILDASDAEALARWLGDHGYATTPDLAAWLDVYVRQHWIISAFKIDKTAAYDARTSAVKMSFVTERPFFPYREPESQRTNPEQPRRTLDVWFIGPERVTGHVGEQPWNGQMFWSESIKDRDVAGVAVDPKWRMTAFEDLSTPRPGFDDLYFERDRDQRERVPPPIVETEMHVTHVPADVVAAPFLVAGLVWWRRRRR